MRRIPRTRRWLNAPARIAGRAGHCRQLPSPLRVQLPEQAVMNLIRVRHPLARRASPSGTGQPQASQLQSHRPHPARRPGRGGFAGPFIRGVAAGQNWPTLTPRTPGGAQ
jgi:hypothetical protein